jgi:hypothetical protein
MAIQTARRHPAAVLLPPGYPMSQASEGVGGVEKSGNIQADDVMKTLLTPLFFQLELDVFTSFHPTAVPPLL